jgi:site-specific recombinase
MLSVLPHFWRALRGDSTPAEQVWDLTALLRSADGAACMAERHLWLIRLLEWLRHAPLKLPTGANATPVLRLRYLLDVLERSPEMQTQVRAIISLFWREVDVAALLADFGFSPRMDLSAEVGQRLRLRLLPTTPDTTDLAELFNLLFPVASDAEWLMALDEATLSRLMALLAPADAAMALDWRAPFLDAVMFLSTTIRAAGFSPLLRSRMSEELLVDAPFRRLAQVAEDIRAHVEAGDDDGLLRAAQQLRALLLICRRCADSVHDHLEDHGISIDLVFELDQLRLRTRRLQKLIDCLVSIRPGHDIPRLLARLVRMASERRSVRALFARHYSLLARKVAERSAEKGEHYITRDRSAYARMLKAAAGGGAVLAGTTLMKFTVAALGLTAFWAGFWAGVNYAGSFMLIYLMQWTVATKQPAMTAPAMAEKLRDVSNDVAVEGFVDEVTHLIRTQSAGILGNLSMVAPLVLGAQLAAQVLFGEPLVGVKNADYVLDSLTLLGPTALFAAFTGVLLFISSLIGGWVENWFVWHRLDSAIAWNPRMVAALGSARAQRWAAYWRNHISGFSSNISLGLMLGIVPVVAVFFGLPLQVRHITLSMGQLSAAVGALGWDVFQHSAFWWCLGGVAVTGFLNLSVSFFLAFRLALRSRGIKLHDRSRIYRAIVQRLWRRPLSFIRPPSGV